MKCMQVFSSSGAELDLVRSFSLVSKVTLCWISSRKDYLDIDIRDIAHDVMLVINNGERRDTLIVHEYEGFFERPVTTIQSVLVLRGYWTPTMSHT